MTKAEKAAMARRIQRAVTGFLIPMMTIPTLYKQLEEMVMAGGTDEDLTEVVAGFPGVMEGGR